MIISVDIGNTNIAVTGFDGEMNVLFVKSYPDGLFHSEKEFLKELEKITPTPSGAVLCSVVPYLTNAVFGALFSLTNGNAVLIDSDFDDGLSLLGYDRKKLGNDRVVDMSAVKSLYKLPAVIFDMGTATTVSVLNSEAVFIGGMILPGISLSVNALSSGTALLPGVKPYAPNSLLGQDTVSGINNGVLYSQACSIEGICSRVEDELGESVTAVITGGAAKLILPLIGRKYIYDEHLLAKGLKILYDKHKRQA